MRPILRPGSHVLRRNDGTLQIGLDPQRAAVLPGDDEVRDCLSRLDSSVNLTPSEVPEHPSTLSLLAANDLLVDSDSLLPLIPVQPATTPGRGRSRRRPAATSRSDVAALALTAGDATADLLRRRSQTRVTVQVFGNSSGHGLADEVTALLVRAGLRPRSGADPEDVDVGVLVGVGEPHREAIDPWLRAGRPHLVVRMTEGSATVGPFVVPGRTACLRCVDAHHTDADPAWPLLVEQYASRTEQDRADGVPEPVDCLVSAVAVGWAARDIVSHAEGHRPSTWSTTLRLDPRLTSIETRSWQRHPSCGCAWE